MQTERPRRRIPGTDSSASADPAAERPRSRTQPSPARNRANAGWGAVDALAQSDGYTKAMALTEDWVLIKFLEDGPFDSFKQHWFEDAKVKGWRCLNVDGQTPCPLCEELGDRARAASSYFNVAAFLDGATPTLQVLRAPKSLTELIKDLHGDRRFKGLTDPRLYATVQKKEPEKKGSPPKFHIQPVRASELDEDWGITEAPSAEVFAALYEERHIEPLDDPASMADYNALVDELLRQA